ncbi:MAG: alpha/beta hydrolase [Streptosporangiaceae bacterium]
MTYNDNFATSADGTKISYRTLGSGPGVVLLHGAMESAHSHMGMATALAECFTVHLPDRRGRGASGPYPDNYGIRTEVEDLAAVLDQTGSSRVFGVSEGGLIVLAAAGALPAIRTVVVYEPALILEGTDYTSWLPRYDREMAEGKVAAALVTSMAGLRLGPPAWFPRGLLVAATKAMMRSQDKKAVPGEPTMRELAPTLHYTGLLLAEMTGKAASFANVTAEVLLLSGSKGLSWLRPGFDALVEVLPNITRRELANLDHGGSGDPSKTNPGGKPDVVAAAARRFFEDA